MTRENKKRAIICAGAFLIFVLSIIVAFGFVELIKNQSLPVILFYTLIYFMMEMKLIDYFEFSYKMFLDTRRNK